MNATLLAVRGSTLASDSHRSPSCARRDAASRKTTLARRSNWLRPMPAVHDISESIEPEATPSEESSPVRSSSHDRYRPARSLIAPSDFPDNGRKRVLRGADASCGIARSVTESGMVTATSCAKPVIGLSLSASASAPGYSSTTIWEFVPDIPKQFTPATRGRSPRRFHSMCSVVTFSGSLSQSTRGFGSLKCSCFGITRCFNASAALIRPAIPAADSRCPILVLTEPISSGLLASRPLQ